MEYSLSNSLTTVGRKAINNDFISNIASALGGISRNDSMTEEEREL